MLALFIWAYSVVKTHCPILYVSYGVQYYTNTLIAHEKCPECINIMTLYNYIIHQ